MELEKGTLVTIKGTAKFSKFIGIGIPWNYHRGNRRFI